MTIDQVIETVSAWPLEHQQILAERLWTMLQPTEPDDREFVEELNRRLESIERGDFESQDGFEMLADMKRRLNESPKQ